MGLDLLQISWLAFIQGVTEFLPISSSAHLILPSLLLGWPDQGLTFDVAMHLGSLFAVMLYFRELIRSIALASLKQLFKGQSSGEARLGWLLIVATIPAGLAGIVLNDFVGEYVRALPVIAAASIVFALLLLWSEKRSSAAQSLESLTLRQAVAIGCAQALALIPGASRSGVTMMAALMCNLGKTDAAKFSFLLSIPIILASGLLKTVELFGETANPIAWSELFYGAALSCLVAFACIHFFLQLINRIGFMPFVIYRLILGAVLLFVYLL